MRKDDFFDIYTSKVGNNDLGGKYKKSWVEESFNFEQSASRQLKTPETRGFIAPTITEKNIRIFIMLIVAGLAIIFLRVFYLQVIRGDYYTNLAENNRLRIKPIPSERGLIYDTEGKQLTENVPSFSLSIVPQDFPKDETERKKIISQISQIGGVSEDEINALVKKYSSYSYESLIVKENLDYDSALSLYVQNANLPGILIQKGTKRQYANWNAPNSLFSLSHILGYLGKLNDEEMNTLKKTGGYLLSDYIGRVGLEKSYETDLRGLYGRKKVEVNALGQEQSVLAEEPPVPGKNLILSLDAEAQEKMELYIKTAMKNMGKKRAAGIALNPQNGEIIAMVSWPAFNNNDFAGGISTEQYKKYSEDQDHPLYNRAISGSYPSGSTIKMMISAAALQEKIITRYTAFLSSGGLQIDKWFFPDWLAGGHGMTNVTKAIAWSVNTFFYTIGGGYGNFTGLGADKIVEYLKKFGLAAKTGIDLPGENEGFLPSKTWKEETKNERWYVGDTYNLSIGQGDVMVTPLQVANWTAAVANGGTVYQPHLVKAIADPVQKQIAVKNPVILNSNFISVENMNIVKIGMRECVVYGSCQSLNTLPFLAAGKTGTAQWVTGKNNHAWFTSFAPYDKPQIVVTVLVEEGGEGSSAAMPIARNFLSWWGKKYLK